MLRHVVWQKFTGVSELLAAPIIMAIRQTTRRNIPEDSHLQQLSVLLGSKGPFYVM
jgi:hypothetical protein